MYHCCKQFLSARVECSNHVLITPDLSESTHEVKTARQQDRANMYSAIIYTTNVVPLISVPPSI